MTGCLKLQCFMLVGKKKWTMENLRNVKFNCYPYKIQSAHLEQNEKLFRVILFSHLKQCLLFFIVFTWYWAYRMFLMEK